MKYIFTIGIILACLTVSQGQTQNQYGAKFSFDPKNEKDPNFVLKDNYNTYLLTVLDVYGMMAGHQVVIRKFDQKNTLVDTYKYDFPKIDAGTMYKYLGFADNQNGKLAVFVEGHSGKENKSELYKLEFDKASAKFTSTLLATNPIISLMKSGEIYLEKSDNGKYIAINFHKYRDKGAADKNQITVVDAGTLNVVWQKEVSFDNEFTSQNFTVTNSGRVILVRDMKGSKKGITYLTIITASGQEDKTFDEQIFLNEMKSVSIGAEEYLVAFNSNSKNFRSDYYNSLLLYDLKLGKILNNTKVREFAAVRDLYEVNIRHIYLQNNEIHVFAEAKSEVRSTNPASFTTAAIMDPKYNFGPALLFVMGFDGQLKTTKKFYAQSNSVSNLYQSFGLANIKGVYYINTGNYGGMYSLAANTFVSNPGINFYTDGQFINQLISYFPDKNSVLLGRTIGAGEMSLVSVTGIN